MFGPTVVVYYVMFAVSVIVLLSGFTLSAYANIIAGREPKSISRAVSAIILWMVAVLDVLIGLSFLHASFVTL